MRLVIGAVAVAVVVAGLMVVLSQLDGGGGSQDTFAEIPQDGITLGREDAPVEIQLYEDFQCPACAQFARETLPELIERQVEPGDARITSQTLSFLGPDSVSTGRAALAAGEQDRYWQYAFLLFENQGAENSGYATDEFLTDLAEETDGLDVEQWQKDRNDASTEEELAAAQERAEEAGVDATPTIVVSGPGGEETLQGAAPLEEVEETIEEAKGS
jgi:protein-disulfide isomerase